MTSSAIAELKPPSHVACSNLLGHWLISVPNPSGSVCPATRQRCRESIQATAHQKNTEHFMTIERIVKSSHDGIPALRAEKKLTGYSGRSTATSRNCIRLSMAGWLNSEYNSRILQIASGHPPKECSLRPRYARRSGRETP